MKVLLSPSERCEMERYITPHSARKCAATEAVLAGIQLIITKAMGYWVQLDILEKYVGGIIGQQVTLLLILAEVHTISLEVKYTTKE